MSKLLPKHLTFNPAAFILPPINSNVIKNCQRAQSRDIKMVSILYQVQQTLEQHLKELKAFGSSCKAYRRFLNRYTGCPYQLYSLHISSRWKESVEAWHRILKEHESYSFVLNEANAHLKVIPNHSFFSDFHRLLKFITNVGMKFRTSLDYAFSKYRKLHKWISEFSEKMKHLPDSKFVVDSC